MKKDILVIGDSCVDVFIYCMCNRLCPEAPVPLLEIESQKQNGGMAYNVYENIISLGASCDIITNNNWQNIKKIRYVDKQKNHMFVRIDHVEPILKIDIKNIDLNYKLIVISDYDKGFLSVEDILYITKNHNNVFIDTKKHLGEWVNNARYIKINNIEYNYSKNYIEKNIKQKVIQTLGSHGCEFNDVKFKVAPVEVIDVAGAGDTFLAGLVVEYIKTNNINNSIIFANKCASKVVQERGVSVIKPNNL